MIELDMIDSHDFLRSIVCWTLYLLYAVEAVGLWDAARVPSACATNP